MEAKTGNKSGKSQIIYILIIVLLAAAAGVLFVQLGNTHAEIDVLKDEAAVAVQEKDQLYSQLDSLEQEILMHMGESEKLDSLLLIKQQEIQEVRLKLSHQEADIAQIEKYKQQITVLRNAADQYIQENAYLKYKVDSLQVDADTKQRTIDTLQIADYQKMQKIEELSSKVEIGSQLRIADLSVLGYNSRGKVMTKAKRVENFKVKGTLLKNQLAEKGKKTVYIRITAPNGIVYTSDPANQFEYDNKTIMYTEKREISYNKEDIGFEVFYDASGDELEAGSYSIIIFCEGRDIGRSEVELK